MLILAFLPQIIAGFLWLMLMAFYLYVGICCVLGCYGDAQLCVFEVQPVST